MSNIQKHELDIKTPDGVAHAWAYRPEGDAVVPAAIFFIDALLVRPSQHEMASRLASLGYFVLLPNVFYRAGEVAPFNPATVWGDAEERARLMSLIHALTIDAAMRDVGAYLDAVSAQKNVRADKIGATGYCLGGRLAFSAAGHFPDKFAAVASFHGGGLVSDAKDSPHLNASKIKARLYFGVADEDQSCTPEHQGALATALGAAHVDYQLELYKGKKHGFAVPDFVGVYDEAAASRHWARLETLFAESLK